MTTERLAPNGQPSNLNDMQWELVRTPNFMDWFGDWQNDPENASKIIDENGEPLVVYHGTNYTWTTAEIRGWGLHVGSLKAANDRIKSFPVSVSPQVKELFLNMRHVLSLNRDYRFHNSLAKVSTELYKDRVITKDEKDDFIQVYSDDATFPNLRALLGDKYGFDGVAYKNNIEDRGSLSYIAFNPNQIKSATCNSNDLGILSEATDEEDYGLR